MTTLPLDLLPLILSELFASCTTLAQDTNLQSTKLVSKSWLHASRAFDFFYVTSFQELDALCAHLRHSSVTRERKRLCLTRWDYESREEFRDVLTFGIPVGDNWEDGFTFEGVEMWQASIKLLPMLPGLEELELEMCCAVEAPPVPGGGTLGNAQNLRRFSTINSPDYYMEL
ncbi:hypothetical protein P7C70_g7769, partial [Phenoliferia sp. Uapishka_3]